MNHQHPQSATVRAAIDPASISDEHKVLNLDGCRLQAIPVKLGRLIKLKFLSLYDNELVSLPTAL